MNDKTDGHDDKKGSRPRSGAGSEGRGGEMRRVFKPKPLGEGGRGPSREAGPRKSFGKPAEASDRGGAKGYKPRPLIADGVPRKPRREGEEGGRSAPRDRGEGEGRNSESRSGEGRGGYKPREGGRFGGTAKPTGPRTSDRSEGDGASRTRAPARAADASTEPAGAMRIAKRLARAGIASRRDAEGMIADGRVRVNGKVLDTPAVTVTGSDKIEVDNQALPATERTRLWLFHKPAGLVTTNRDPEGRTTVFEKLPEDMPRVLSIGRLDINTEGLLLLTNDGGLARILELPSTGWLRRYRVRAHGTVSQAQLDELRQGIAIEGVFYGAIEATLDREQGHNVWLTLGLREGKNREVKRILGHLGLDVNRLIRLSFGPFQLGDLPEGAVREIKGRLLRDQLGERLIEEAGADFDAPIVNTFTNQVVTAEKAEAAKVERSEWVSATVERPNRKKFGEAKREAALGRLDTKPRKFGETERKPYGAKSFGDRPARGPREDRPQRDDRPARGRDDRPERGAPRGTDGPGAGDRDAAPKKPGGPRRMANVWMAPGARPESEKAIAARAEKAKLRKDRPHPFGHFRKSEGEARETSRSDGPKRASTPSRVGDRAKGKFGGGAGEGGDRPRPRPGNDGAPRGRGPDRGPRGRDKG